VSRYEDRYGDQDDKVEKNEAETVKEPRWNEWNKDADEIELLTKVEDSDHDDMEGEEEGYIANTKGADI
jgi:hypothetical protein